MTTKDMLPGLRLFRWNTPRVLALAAATALVAGIGLGWQWLQTGGALSLVLSVLPCLVMCAAGICMNRMSGGGRCDSKAADPDQNNRGGADDRT